MGGGGKFYPYKKGEVRTSLAVLKGGTKCFGVVFMQ